MPTGYTAKLMEDGQTFQEFIMGCARAFGALIEMRDSPNDAVIPDKFEPSTYHDKRLVESVDELKRLKLMDDSEKEAFGQSERDAAVKRDEELLARCINEDSRLEAMALQVMEWSPPTPDHQELKNFMLQQIDISKNGAEYAEQSLINDRNKPAMAYYVGSVSRAASSITYHTEEKAKETVRAAKRTEWVHQLRASIGS